MRALARELGHRRWRQQVLTVGELPLAVEARGQELPAADPDAASYLGQIDRARAEFGADAFERARRQGAGMALIGLARNLRRRPDRAENTS